MSVLWTSDDAVRATGGKSAQKWQTTGVSIDTRTLQHGDLFVALSDIRDGHDFVAQALDNGAAAALVSRIPEGVASDAPLLIVNDVLVALGALGRAARTRCDAQVVAVTGSVGKTSTKEMLLTMLAAQGQVHAAVDSYNNHWGVPLTLARMPEDTDFAIIEIGMNHPGEIAPLAEMTRPHVALITNVAPVHMEAFDDVQGIAHEKAAIFGGLEKGGVAVINADLDTTALLLKIAQKHRVETVTFGEATGADIQLDQVQLSGDTTVIQASAEGETLLFKLNASGKHFAMNALGALAAVRAIGADMALAALDLANWTPPPGRGAKETIVLDVVDDHLTLTLLDDAFNASPISMAAALDVLAASNTEKGRRVAILGDMLELGPSELQLHLDIADLPAMDRIDLVHCVGPLMQALHGALPEYKRGEYQDTAPEMATRAPGLLRAGDIILVKGSKGSKVSLVVDAIKKLGHPHIQQKKGAI